MATERWQSSVNVIVVVIIKWLEKQLQGESEAAMETNNEKKDMESYAMLRLRYGLCLSKVMRKMEHVRLGRNKYDE